jgi:hypothetical protein
MRQRHFLGPGLQADKRAAALPRRMGLGTNKRDIDRMRAQRTARVWDRLRSCARVRNRHPTCYRTERSGVATAARTGTALLLHRMRPNHLVVGLGVRGKGLIRWRPAAVSRPLPAPHPRCSPRRGGTGPAADPVPQGTGGPPMHPETAASCRLSCRAFGTAPAGA